MKVGKPKSKRVSVRLRHRIEKASSAKQRKERKGAKTNPQWRSRLKKDPGIPNMFPYKAEVLAEIEESRRKKEEEAQKRREVAKAQRLGTAVVQEAAQKPAAADEDEELLDLAEDDDDEMEVQDDSNPMAALLASARARASAYSKDDEVDEEDDDEEGDEWNGIQEAGAPAPAKRKALPKQVLADPIKAVSALMERMQKTQDGIQRMIDQYNIPPVVTTGSEAASRFLVEVARKRGRLGRGGVPNLHAAALIVLGDLNEERLQLPAVVEKKPASAAGKGEVQIVTKMAEPFRIEGLFGDDKKGGHGGAVDAMVVEA
ncbi:hypothetical protein LTR36_000908 [Oleoguttula mirabilis]|uniref:Guanine nucleotide-binding protein-like 3 N-terminal domain-containing protein n=1 Tax=Oleoguttula mirabilis TaxID=1507867 RepID=A0AAV9JPF5_9PEZI|nr:hypothetical protein LTR36_000908 [Oleoguttula mirabilis]